MTAIEGRRFVETMGRLGDVWTEEQVMQVYPGWSYGDALKDRSESLGKIMEFVGAALG